MKPATKLHRYLNTAFLASFLAPLLPVAAQDIRWEPPPTAITVDFSGTDPAPRIVFIEEGMALELPLNFGLVGHKQVTVQAKGVDGGRFTLDRLGDGDLLELKALEGNTYELLSTLDLLSPQEVQEQARQEAMQVLARQHEKARGGVKGKKKDELEFYLRQHDCPVPQKQDELVEAFVDRRTIELGEQNARDALAEFAKEHPQWANKSDQARWKAMNDAALFQAWVNLLSVRIANVYLKRCGINVDLNRPGSEKAVSSKFLGLYAFLSGSLVKPKDSSDDKERERQTLVQAFRTLSPEESARLRKGLTARLACRYWFPVDGEDLNSQWFHAQRVVCPGKAISIKVQGKLDPKHHDATDWWTLVGYDPSVVSLVFPKNTAYRHEIFSDKSVGRLRVAATGDQPTEYTFELRPLAAAGDNNVVIHETQYPRPMSFPY